MRRPGILSEAISPEEVSRDIAKDAGLIPNTWYGLPATFIGVPTKWIVTAGVLFGVAKSAKLI